MKTQKNEVAQVNTPELVTMKPIQTKHLAAHLNLKPTTLRRILRSMPEYADGVHTNYRWAEKDPMFEKIFAKVTQLEADKNARAETAKKALEARIALAAARITVPQIQ